MKMTSSTSRISINGVMLMSALGAALFLTFFILRPYLLYLLIDFFGQQADLVDTCCSQVIDHLFDIPVLRAEVTLYENGLVETRAQQDR